MGVACRSDVPVTVTAISSTRSYLPFGVWISAQFPTLLRQGLYHLRLAH